MAGRSKTNRELRKNRGSTFEKRRVGFVGLKLYDCWDQDDLKKVQNYVVEPIMKWPNRERWSSSGEASVGVEKEQSVDPNYGSTDSNAGMRPRPHTE